MNVSGYCLWPALLIKQRQKEGAGVACACVCVFVCVFVIFADEQSKEDKSSDVKVEAGEKSSPIPVVSSTESKQLTVTVSGEETDLDQHLGLVSTGESSPGLLQITSSSKDVEDLQRHRSSASTLNDPTSSSCLGQSQEMELQALEQEEYEASALARSPNASKQAVGEEEEKGNQVGLG